MKKTINPKPPTNQVVELSPTDFDNYWKHITEVMFEQFVAYFFPDVYPLVDFAVKPVYLEQELTNRYIKERKGKKRIADKLVKLRLKDGGNTFLFVHAEFHATGESSFSSKMYEYMAIFHLKYHQPLTAIAIFVTDKTPSNAGLHHWELFGTELSYRYRVFKVKDQTEADLLADKNPFALVVLTCLCLIKSKKAHNLRLEYKKVLYELCQQKNYTDYETFYLSTFVSELINLPKELEIDFTSFVNKKI